MRRSPTRRLAQPYHQSLVLRLNVTLVIALVLTLLRIDEVNSFGANGVKSGFLLIMFSEVNVYKAG